MYRKSHIYFALATLPCFFIPVKINFDKFNFINDFISSYNKFIYFTINNILNHPIQNIGLIIMGLILYILGSLFPDIDLKLKKFLPDKIAQKQYYYHRQFTHSLLMWLFILYFFTIKFNNSIIYWFLILFILGNINHLIADMLTGTVPWLLYGHYGKIYSRIGITTFFPNRKKTNNPNEKSSMNYFFTRYIPQFLEKKQGVIFFILLFILSNYFLIQNMNIF